MIPLFLSIKNFGPFLNEQSIDFKEVIKNNIFLITGSTGAGKTSIYDAITFSLYGKSSGSVRKAESMQSDFSMNTDETFVNFTFSIKNEIYTIKRVMKRKKITLKNTITETPARAELTLPDKTIVEGITEVNKKIIEIIGLNQLQFSKIVMLAQGEFQKLLQASSDEKESLFRNIFSTHKFQEFSDNLKKLEKEKKIILDQKLEIKKNIIKDINFLDENINIEYIDKEYILKYLETEKENLYNKYISTQNLVNTKNKEKNLINLQYAIDINQKFKEKSEIEDQINIINNKKDEMILKDNLIKKFNNLYPIVLLKKDIENINNQYIEHLNQFDILNKKLSKFTLLHQNIELLYNEIPILSKSKNEISSNIEKLNKVIPMLEKKDEIYKNILNNKNSSEIIILNIKNIEHSIKNKTLEIELIDIENQINQINLIIQNSLKLKESLDLSKKLKEDYNMGAHIYDKSISYSLAKELAENQSCPVCGSQNHPEKPKKPKNIISYIDLQNLNKIYASHLQKIEKERWVIKDNIDILKSITYNIIDNYTYNENYTDTYKFMDNIKQKLLAKKSLISSEIIKNTNIQNFKSNDNMSNLEKSFIQNEEKLSIMRDCIEKDSLEYKAILSKISEKHKNISDIKKNILDLKNKLNSIEEQIKKSEINYNTSCININYTKENLLNYKNNIIDIEKDIIDKENNLKKLMKKLEISNLDCIDDVLNIENNYDNIKKDVDYFFSNMYEKQSILKKINQDLNGKEKFDIDAMEKLLFNIQNQLENYNLIIIDTKTNMNNLDQISIKIKQIFYELEILTKEYQNISLLNDISSGKNESKLKFETFVLTSYFDEIINATNIRLDSITNGRFYLNRKTSRSQGNKNSGLDLEIFDSYTGKYRESYTLSGGESFQTSLALALGLSDTISQNYGGIEINTIFIDEGFGSLDSFSLDNIVNCLTNLTQTGRIVCIISHVQELKERIDTKIYVSPSSYGSSISI
ncbi:MAG: AAA family ATPase [Oscillospiraceae bacterium]|nr:AAA family ATPase [Oscillospiraceae bacterium]